jgi:hypothetical protein
MRPNSTVELTRLTKTDGPLTKRISLNADGTLLSDGSACLMSHGTAERVRITSVDELALLIGNLEPSQAIALGALRPGLPNKVEIVAKSKLNGSGRKDVIARTKTELVYCSPALALLDFDSKAMPEAVAAQIRDLGGIGQALQTVLPALGTTAHVVRRSTTTGIIRADTGEALPGSGGLHVYIQVQDGADIARFLKTLHKRCWLHGLGWMMVGAAGSLLERSIIDRTVGGPERLVFEGGPILLPPLQQDRESRRPIAVAGEMLDTLVACPPLALVERAKFDQCLVRERARLASEAARVREGFIAVHVKAIVARTGKSTHAARKSVERQLEGVLRPDIELQFDDSTLAGGTVGDVLADPDRFVGETLADPLEGIAYGRCKAMIMRRADGTLWINSFAHGRTTYDLKLDVIGVRAAVGIAAKEDVVATLARLAVESDLDAVEMESLRQEAKKLSGAGLKAIKDAIKVAEKESAAKAAKTARVAREATRRDPRPQLQAPASTTPWLPQMGVLNGVVGKTTAARPPARDIDTDAMRARKLPVPNMHAFTQLEVNVEPEETTK